MRNLLLFSLILLTSFLAESVNSARNANRTENEREPNHEPPEVTIAKPHPIPPSPSPLSKRNPIRRRDFTNDDFDDENEDDVSRIEDDDGFQNDHFQGKEEEEDGEEQDLLHSQPSARTHVSTAFANVFQHCSWPGQKSKLVPFTLSITNRNRSPPSSEDRNKTSSEGAYASWVKVKGLSSKGAFVKLETLSYLFADIQFYFVDAKGRDIDSSDLGVSSSLSKTGRDDILSRWFLQLMKRTVKTGSKRSISSSDANALFRSFLRSISVSRLVDPIGIFQYKAVKHFMKLPYILIRELFEGFGAEDVFDFVYDSIVLSVEIVYEFIAYWVSFLNGNFDSSLYSSTHDAFMNNKASSVGRASPAFLLNPFEPFSFILVRRVNATSLEPSAKLFSPSGFRCQVNPLAFRYPLYLFSGLVLFDNAESLVTNTYALYAGGFAFSITIVLAVLLVFLYRSSNDRRVVLPTIAALMYGSFAGQTGNQYDPISLLRYIGFDEVADVVSEYYPVLLLICIWIVALLLVSFKNILPFDRNFLMNSLTWGLRLLGVWLSLNSSNVMSLGVIVLFVYFMVKTGKFILNNGVSGFISSTSSTSSLAAPSAAVYGHYERENESNNLRRPSTVSSAARTPTANRDVHMSPAPAPLSSGLFSFFRNTPSPSTSTSNITRPLSVPGRPSLSGGGGGGGGGIGRPIFSGGRVHDPSPSGHSMSSFSQSQQYGQQHGQHHGGGGGRRGSPSPVVRASAMIDEKLYETNGDTFEEENEEEGEGRGDWIPEDGDNFVSEEVEVEELYENEGRVNTGLRRRGSFANTAGR
jgi:hypothetical protein